MGKFRFDPRWLVLLVVFVVLSNARSLPWPIVAALLAGGGGYLLYWGLNLWRGGVTSRSGPRVQYWRGQRIESPTPRRPRMPPLREILPAVIPLLVGAAMLLAAFSLIANRI